MKLKEALDIDKGSMVSIVGAGGKTTLMYSLAEELRNEYKCLVTTTTKIYVPFEDQFDYLAVSEYELEAFKEVDSNGVFVYGTGINDEGKLLGAEPEGLEPLKQYFDYTLIEADGSKRKPLKGWKDSEPVICKGTTHTIAVLSVEALGKEVNEYNIHRIEEFLSITSAKRNEKVKIEHFEELIFHPKGLFKNSLGERILFINKVENEEQWNTTEKLISCIKYRNNSQKLLDKIIIGSLLKKHYKMQRNDGNAC